MPFNPLNPLAGFTMNPLTPIPESQMTGPPQNKWANILSILGATLQDTGAAVGGRQGNALNNYTQYQDQKKLQDQQQLAQASLSSAFIDANRAGTQPNINALLPAISQLSPGLAVQLLAQVQPKAPDPFTLGPGQTRFGADGKPVAALPNTPAAPSGFNLSPGQTRFGPDGKPIVSLPAAPTGTNAPQTRTRIEGTNEVVEEYDPANKTWKRVSAGPRWAPAKTEDGGPGITDQGVLRREFNTEAGTFETVATSTVRALEAAKDPSAAGDLALIFNYMKILDPGSVVREAEFATAQNAAGVPERIRAMYNNVINGERLSESTRSDFVDRAKRLYKGQAGQFENKVLKRYRDLAGRYNIPAENIIQDYRIDLSQYEQPSQAPSPQAGAGGAPVRVTTPDEAMRLPVGTIFITPDGRT